MKKNGIIALMVMAFACSASAKEDITARTYEDATFSNERLSSDETGYLALPTEWAHQYGSGGSKVMHLDKTLAELIRLRVGQLDNCNYCIILHTKEALKLNIPESKVFSLSTWQQSGLFDVREKAALLFAESVSQVDQRRIQPAFDGLKAAGFTAAETEELTNTVILMNIWSREFMVQGKTSAPPVK